MIREPQAVREELRRRILLGYTPSWSMESAEDHDVDWLCIEFAEWKALRDSALKERARYQPAGRPDLNSVQPPPGPGGGQRVSISLHTASSPR